MELVEENLDLVNLNVESFSKMIGETWDIPMDTLKNYILANVSIAITRNSEMKKDINKLYILDTLEYYNAVKNSSCTNHIVMTEGTLEQEIEGRKALGILLISEKDYNLRNTVISLLRKYYPIVFNAVKKHDKRELHKRYIQMDAVTRRTESRLEAAVYFYFCVYRSVEEVDQNFFKSIMDDVKSFEFYDPITRDITKELELHKSEIQEMKALLKRKYGKINSYKDILNSDISVIEDLGAILDNIFIINKLDVDHLFAGSNFLNIDEILLAYIKRGNKFSDPKAILETIVNGIFIRSLINAYKKARELYFQNNHETLLIKVNSLQQKLNSAENMNKDISIKFNALNQQNLMFDKTLNTQINKLNKIHSSQVIEMENKIKDLENKLLVEKKYRNELNSLREYIFKVNNDYIPFASEKTLGNYIESNNIIIIGGAKEWRRKFRDKYPEIRSLNGFNENFDTTILSNYDYVFFYSGFMNHATYYRAMSFIRTHHIKFGYLGKTNIYLVEEELIDELEKNVLK